MLHKQRSTRTAILKYGLFLPLFAIMLMLSSATIRSNKAIIAVTEEIPLNEPLTVVKEAIGAPAIAMTPKKATPLKTIDPKDPAWQKFYKFFQMNVRFPSEAQKNGLQGYSQIKFTVKDGKTSSLRILNQLGSGCDVEVMRVLSSYKDFTKAQDGNYTLPVLFKLSKSTSLIKNPTLTSLKGYTRLSTMTIIAYSGPSKTPFKGSSTDLSKVKTDPNDNKVYDFVTVNEQPTFPGGMANFYKYLSSAVKYPKEAQEKNIQGKVFLSFIVEKDGTLHDIKVERKLDSDIDAEAVRVLKESPKWIPGIMDNKFVRVKYNIPISFTLSEPAPAPKKS